MALTLVVAGAQINASDLNQTINVLQRSAGQSEVGHYRLAGGAYAVGAVVSHWVNTLSRGSTPVSLTIDTLDGTPSNLNAPSAPIGNANAGGFLIFATATAINGNANCAGNWTANY